MRVSLVIAAVLLVAYCARSNEPSSDPPIPWQAPFEAISASKAADALVLVLVTNEDPFLDLETTGRLGSGKDEAGNPNRSVWCADVLSLAYRQTLDRRVDLRGRLTLQSIAAGLPKEVTGGEPRNTPARAVVALCDGNYRLLAFAVGVPDTKDLLTLIEDGEDFAAIGQLHADRPSEIVSMMVQRSSERLSRLWRGALQEMVVAMQGDRGDDQPDGLESELSFEGRMRMLGETFEAPYLADVKLRYGLTKTTDQTRLVILEQHTEARRGWCEAMIPFTAGSDFSSVWPELVESIWGHQPITREADTTELLQWYDLQAKTDAMVLSIKAPFHLRRLPWPPITDIAAKRGLGWQEVHDLALKHPFRTVDPQQLANLIRARKLNAVDIQRPSVARYVYLEPNKNTPLVIHEADPPGRFAGLLKRSKSNLVKE